MQQAPVLLVDDDPVVRSTVRELLEFAGHRVLSARNGVEAQALIEVEPPWVVILDLYMPAAGGWEFARHLRRSTRREVPVVVFSGCPDLETEARRIGAARFVKKPSPPGVLLAVLDGLRPGCTGGKRQGTGTV